MRFSILGSGAVGGYYGARLAQAGHDVTFVARGAHLDAIRRRGLSVRGPLGDFTVRAGAEELAARVPAADVVIYAVKAYSNAAALPIAAELARDSAVVLTLQNGVDSADEVAAAAGADRVLAGSVYVAAALTAPGLVEQTGTHHRILLGEVSGDTSSVSPRTQRIADAFADAGVECQAVPDARVPIWEKFCYLAPFAAFTGAARLPIGPLWSDRAIRLALVDAFREVECLARAERVAIHADLSPRIVEYVQTLPPSTRSSLLIDLQQGKPIEVEALAGAVVRRGARAGVPTPILGALYAVLKPHAGGVASG